MRPAVLTEDELAKRGFSAAAHIVRDDPLWPGQLATLAALALYFALPPKLTIGPGWLVPAAEFVLFLGLVAATPRRGMSWQRRRMMAIVLTSAVTVANLVALGLLTHYLVAGGRTGGANLLDGGVVIWGTNLAIFAVWYWELDRGGPASKAHGKAVAPDFLFSQMADAQPYSEPGWKPGFGDYLYLSFTNQTAFSPTDTMPLTYRAKLLMGLQGLASLITVGVIVARAVNILA
jgi:hypothetical protein